MDEYITKQEARAALLQGPWKPNEWHVINILITSIPPADVRPVVRGRWEISCDGWYPYCPVCKEEPPGRTMTPFCPMCSADMRGGDADGNTKD